MVRLKTYTTIATFEQALIDHLCSLEFIIGVGQVGATWNALFIGGVEGTNDRLIRVILA